LVITPDTLFVIGTVPADVKSSGAAMGKRLTSEARLSHRKNRDAALSFKQTLQKVNIASLK
jgi:hypothetical protein